MEDNTNTDLGLVARAAEATKIYFGSNTVNHLDGIVHTNTIETLGNFVKKKSIETRAIDPDTKVDDKLLKYTITRITPTKHLDEVNNYHEIYLITDEHGHDIGTYEITENGPVFKLSPKIKEYNEKVIEMFPEAQQEILREKYDINNLEELTDKLAKGEKIALASKEQAQDDIEQEYEKRGLSTSNGTIHEDPEEEKAIASIPSDMRGEIIQQCRDRGISIKSVIVVDCPDCLIDEIDNEKVGIQKGRGPVILVQARSGDASLADDVYAFQGDQEIPNANAEKEKLADLMNQHEGKAQVTELEDKRKEELELKIAQQLELEKYRIEQNPEAKDTIEHETALAISSLVNYYGYEDDKDMQELVDNANAKATEEDEHEEDEHEEPTIYNTHKPIN